MPVNATELHLEIIMSSFTNVAIWGYNQILCARTEELAVTYGQQNFPGLTEGQARQLYNHELTPTFSDDGNTMRLPD